MLSTSSAVQDYLKGVYLLTQADADEPVMTTSLARQLGVSAASATNMLKKLDQAGLVEHAPYRGVRPAARTRSVVHLYMGHVRRGPPDRASS
ncbi:MAG TPA: MarR family transcriptional regulator, partial [Actinomycetota bacterium]|nr:MarR family transcriptional regulator [Actinomycetota bacterium]